MKKPVNILLVDDDDLFTFLFGEYMKECDFPVSVKQLNHGLLALNYLDELQQHEQQQPDIVFLDLSMPVMDGWEFIDEFSQWIKKTGKTIPLFIVSSSISPYDIERARSLKTVKDFIIKPASPEKIISLIKNSVNNF